MVLPGSEIETPRVAEMCGTTTGVGWPPSAVCVFGLTATPSAVLRLIGRSSENTDGRRRPSYGGRRCCAPFAISGEVNRSTETGFADTFDQLGQGSTFQGSGALSTPHAEVINEI